MMNLSSFSKLAGVLLTVGILTLVQSSFTSKTTDELSVSRVIFNGAPLSTSTMLLDARGTLSMVQGDAADVQSKKIPFQVYLKRGDVIIKQASSVQGRIEHEVEVGKLLLGAKQGDELIIEPVQSQRAQARHVVKLAGYTTFHWFPIAMGAGNGC